MPTGTSPAEQPAEPALGRSWPWRPTPESGQLEQQAKGFAATAQENPMGLAIGAAAVGFVAGMLIPSTHVEDEHIGPVTSTSVRSR